MAEIDYRKVLKSLGFKINYGKTTISNNNKFYFTNKTVVIWKDEISFFGIGETHTIALENAYENIKEE